MRTASVKNRGYHKIEGAARAFDFDFRGKTVLDIGSSTGGFTRYALERGAKKVIAVEKGTNQMMKPLRYDPRIDLHEKTDIFDVMSGARSNPPSDTLEAVRPSLRSSGGLLCTPDVVVADVSFVSLKKILAHVARRLADNHTEFLVMLKPQFEARPDQLNKGVVKNEKIRREIIKLFEQWLKQNGFVVVNKRDNDLRGKTGNQERFYYLKLAK